MVEDPRRLGPYRIIDALGRGSMGVVYRARHEGDGTVVALKTVGADEPALVRALRREAHALRRIRHPGIVHVVDDGVDRGLPWYAMEFVEGTTLRQLIDEMWRVAAPRPSPSVAAGDLRRALSITRRLCDALDFLHGEGLIHRDLKPENVILRPGEQPVIVDFGFVRAFAGARGREVVEAGGVLEVTIGYAAPEQMRGDLVDARADLYALGCILYEILTGRPVFDGGDEWELQQRHLDEQPAPPSRWVAGVPAALDELVLGLLNKEPHDRIGYAADVAAMVARMEGGAPAPERPARVYLYRPELAGRAALLDELQRTVLEARRGRGAMVLLAGESGVGKTRLATELATFAERRGSQVVASECAPLPAHAAASTPALQAPLQPLQRLFQAVADECRDPDRMQEILGAHAPLLAHLAPVIAGLPGVPAAPETPRIATAETRQQTIAAITSVVRVMAARRPLVLVVDDLQWADDLTIEVLGSLARSDLRGVPLLVLGTYRTEETSEALVGLGAAENVRSYKLDKLDEAAVASIIGNMLAIAAPPAPFVQFLAAESGGNPFFVAEYLRTAAQVGLLDVDGRGRWQLGARAAALDHLLALPLPSSLRDLLGRWLSALSPSARSLVAFASVLGRSFDGDLLGTETSDELEGLEDLRRRGVLEEDRAGRLRFSHDKLREIAYESIAEPDRRKLHAQAVDRIQARTDASAPSWFAALAHHYTAAQIDDKAFEYLEKAASHALRLGAHRTTVDTLRRAFDLAALRGRAATALVDDARRARWHSALGEAWFCLGDLTEARKHLQVALEGIGVRLPGTQREWALTVLKQAVFQVVHAVRPTPEPVPEDERERMLAGARSASKLCECHYYRQELLAVTGSALLAVNLAERAGRRNEVRRQVAQLGYMAGLFRAHPLARRYLRQSHAPGPDDAPGERGTALYYASSYEATFCRWEEAERLADMAIAELTAAHNLHELQIARTMRAHVHYWRGELAAALPLFDAVRRDAGAAANVQLQAWGAYASARSLVALGRLEEAVPLLREALRLLEGQADRSSHIICRGLLAEALVRLGDLEGARAEADAVLTLAEGGRPAALTEGCGYAGAADTYLELWARAAARRQPAEELAGRARRACRVLDGVGAMFPLAGPAARRCRARMLALGGHGFRARRAWQGALALARELRMPYEEALIELDLGRTAGARTARGVAHLRRSIEIFDRLDCRARAAEVGTLLE